MGSLTMFDKQLLDLGATVGQNGTISFVNGNSVMWSVEAAAIPEPSTYAMLVGACTLGFAAWRRRCKNTPATAV